MKRVSLELGGKSPSIIFPDADLDAAAAAAMAGVWGASGQVCTCSTRVLVHESVHDEVVETDRRAVARACASAAGSTRTPRWARSSRPRSSSASSATCGIGQDEGAELALGGARHGDRGYFHEPTVFTGVRNDMTIAQEEIFGPVMSVLKFASEEEAYRIANDVEYGLAAGVWTNDLARAHRATRALRVGTVWVNTYQMVYPSVPVRRRQAVGPRPQPRRGVARRVHADQERLDEGGLTWRPRRSARIRRSARCRTAWTSPTCSTATRRRSTASTTPACAACWPTTSGRSTATPIRSSAATRVAAWIGEAIANVVWQHHLLSVYHVEVDGDRASALVYHTSHQVFEDDPDTAKLLVGRYHNELRREPDGWRISRLVLEILWGEEQDGRRRLPRADRRPRAAGELTRPMRAAEPFELGQLTLRNRLVGTAHGRGILEDGLPLPEDAEYWRRLAAGGAAMLTVGGTVVAPESTWRRRITTEAWRPEAVPGMAARAEAIRAEGAVAACQLVHLGPRDDRRRAVVPPGGPVGGALAARADAAAAAERRRARRGRRGLPPSRRSTPPRRGSRSSSCTPRTATCSRSSWRRRRTAGPAPSADGRLASSRASSREIRVVGARRSWSGSGCRSTAGRRRPGAEGLCELLPHARARSPTT